MWAVDPYPYMKFVSDEYHRNISLVASLPVFK